MLGIWVNLDTINELDFSKVCSKIKNSGFNEVYFYSPWNKDLKKIYDFSAELLEMDLKRILCVPLCETKSHNFESVAYSNGIKSYFKFGKNRKEMINDVKSTMLEDVEDSASFLIQIGKSAYDELCLDYVRFPMFTSHHLSDSQFIVDCVNKLLSKCEVSVPVRLSVRCEIPFFGKKFFLLVNKFVFGLDYKELGKIGKLCPMIYSDLNGLKIKHIKNITSWLMKFGKVAPIIQSYWDSNEFLMRGKAEPLESKRLSKLRKEIDSIREVGASYVSFFRFDSKEWRFQLDFRSI